MPEYYVKLTPQGEALGPFTPAQLQVMANEEKISPSTPHYCDDITGWQPIEANPALVGELWPSKKKLSLKKNTIATPSETPAAASLPATPAKPVKAKTVQEMLEAAQGNTKENKNVTAQKRWSDHTAALALPILGLLHLVMGVLMLLTNWDVLAVVLEKGDWMIFLMSPGLAMAGLLLIIGLALVLSVTAVYSWARYSALMLMGYLSIHSWVLMSSGQTDQSWAILGTALGFGLGVYTITVTLNFSLFCFATIAAFGGVLAYGWAYFLA